MGYLRRKTEADDRAAPPAHGERRRLRAAGLNGVGYVPLRRRLALVCASAVALAILLAAIVCYVVVRSSCSGRSTASSSRRPGSSHSCGRALTTAACRRRAGTAGGGAADLVRDDERRQRGMRRRQRSPAVRRPRAVDRGRHGGPYFQDVKVGGTTLRELDRPGQRSRRSFGCPIGGAPARAPSRPGRQRPLGPASRPVAAVRRRASRSPPASGACRGAGAGAAGRGRRDRAAHHRDRGSDEPDPRTAPTTRSGSSPRASTR